MSQFQTIELDLELLTDICPTASNRTLGEPELSWTIPGRLLWGAAATAAYQAGLAPEEAFRLFHQGAVRILDAVPVTESGRGYPVPKSWQIEKNKLDPIHNFALPEVRQATAGLQCKPCPESWIGPDGSAIQLEVMHTLRTSVDPGGRAREGLLFGLPVIVQGTRFWTALSGAPADVDQVMRFLAGQVVRIGRSRNAELGMVRVSRRTSSIGALASGKGATKRISFLCVSRAVLRDPQTGAPTLLPGPTAFGLPAGWVFEAESSFLRSARIVHFNSHRRRPEPERYAIERGSVVTFSGPDRMELAQLQSALVGGVGEHRGQGYGEVLVAPAWLTERQVSMKTCKKVVSGTVPEPGDELFQWASAQAVHREKAMRLYEKAREGARELRAFGVKPAQWGVLRQLARQERFAGSRQGAATLLEQLKNRLASGRRKLDRAWGKAGPALDRLCQRCEPADLPVFLEHLASACMRPENGGNRA